MMYGQVESADKWLEVLALDALGSGGPHRPWKGMKCS